MGSKTIGLFVASIFTDIVDALVGAECVTLLWRWFVARAYVVPSFGMMFGVIAMMSLLVSVMRRTFWLSNVPADGQATAKIAKAMEGVSISEMLGRRIGVWFSCFVYVTIFGVIGALAGWVG